MCGSSGLASFYLPLLVWQLAPPINGACPTGEPVIPTTSHSSFSSALADYSACLWCSSLLRASAEALGNLQRAAWQLGPLPMFPSLRERLIGANQQAAFGDSSRLSCSDSTLMCLQLCPLDLPLGQSWLWEWKWMSSLVQVTDLLSHSVCSSRVVVAAWPCKVLACLKCPGFPAVLVVGWVSADRFWSSTSSGLFTFPPP